jgi:hypothetical protein
MPSRLLLALGAFAVAITAGCSRSTSSPVGVELTTKELLELHQIDVDASITEKFEWNFPTRRYTRVTFERSEDGGRTWRVLSAQPSSDPVTGATVMFKFDRRGTPADDKAVARHRFDLHVELRRDRASNRSHGTRMIEIPALTSWQSEVKRRDVDPDRLFFLQAGNLAYRLRWESAEQPWAG